MLCLHQRCSLLCCIADSALEIWIRRDMLLAPTSRRLSGSATNRLSCRCRLHVLFRASNDGGDGVDLRICCRAIARQRLCDAILNVEKPELLNLVCKLLSTNHTHTQARARAQRSTCTQERQPIAMRARSTIRAGFASLHCCSRPRARRAPPRIARRRRARDSNCQLENPSQPEVESNSRSCP